MGILFAYAHEERVRTLTENRVMASIPFGGRYRLVDFILSNMVNSGINQVGIITEENYLSLMDHLGSGKAWDLSRKNEGLMLLPPFGTTKTRQNGKVEALSSIKRFFKTSSQEYVLLGDCDVIANMDFTDVFDFHDQTNADITVLYKRGTSPDTEKNVIFTVDPKGSVREVLIKRGSDAECNFSLGVYLMKKELLTELVDDCMSRNLYDFDRDILQRCLPDLSVSAYEFKDVMYQITAFDAYFSANMALFDPKVRDQLFNPLRPIYTKVRDDRSTKYGLDSVVSNSIVADGCEIDGEVENCVLFRGVKVKKGAKIKNCVIMQDGVVSENCKLDYVVADKNVVFTEDKTLMGYHTYPVFVMKGSKV